MLHFIGTNISYALPAHGFWPGTFKDCIDILQAAAVITASLVALRGINAWREEFLGRRRIELAEEVLALFYQAKDLVEFIRFPAGLESEASGRKPESSETPPQKTIRDDAYAWRERYTQNSAILSRIWTLRYRFMAQFGRDSVAPFDELKSIIGDLFVALQQWVMLSEHQQPAERIEKHEKTLWGMGEDDDAIQSRLDKLITHIEEICEPHIDSHRTSSSRKG